MEWCGWDWPCIWGSVFSSASAAWVQAIFTIVGLCLTLWLSNRKVREQRDYELGQSEMKERSAKIANALKLAKIQGISISYLNELPLSKDSEKKKVNGVILDVQESSLRKSVSLMEELLVQESCHENVAVAAVGFMTSAGVVQKIIFSMLDEIQSKVPGAQWRHVNAELPESNRRLILSQVGAMTKVRAATLKFVEELRVDKDAQFPRIELVDPADKD